MTYTNAQVICDTEVEARKLAREKFPKRDVMIILSKGRYYVEVGLSEFIRVWETLIYHGKGGKA